MLRVVINLIYPLDKRIFVWYNEQCRHQFDLQEITETLAMDGDVRIKRVNTELKGDLIEQFALVKAYHGIGNNVDVVRFLVTAEARRIAHEQMVGRLRVRGPKEEGNVGSDRGSRGRVDVLP
jgi:hypothetical protein